jgi:hypothetical protein
VHDGLTHHAGERLALVLRVLAVALDPVPEDLVEKNAGGSSVEDGGPDVGFDYGRLDQGPQIDE